MGKRARPQQSNEDPPDESWMATYADAITLLMAFFVMLLTFAEYDLPAFDEAAAAISERVGGTASQSPTQMLRFELEDAMFEMNADQAVDLTKNSRGLTIEIRGGAFFKPGSAEIRDVAKPVLKRIAGKLSSPNFRCFNVEAIGHTDDVPIRNALFQSNWELSVSRAAAIVRFFVENDINRNRLKASGFAETQPKVPNIDQSGEPILENRATNRRIEILVERMNLEDQRKCNETINFKKLVEKISIN